MSCIHPFDGLDAHVGGTFVSFRQLVKECIIIWQRSCSQHTHHRLQRRNDCHQRNTHSLLNHWNIIQSGLLSSNEDNSYRKTSFGNIPQHISRQWTIQNCIT